MGRSRCSTEDSENHVSVVQKWICCVDTLMMMYHVRARYGTISTRSTVHGIIQRIVLCSNIHVPGTVLYQYVAVGSFQFLAFTNRYVVPKIQPKWYFPTVVLVKIPLEYHFLEQFEDTTTT
jgi:hypothetical protein